MTHVLSQLQGKRRLHVWPQQLGSELCYPSTMNEFEIYVKFPCFDCQFRVGNHSHRSQGKDQWCRPSLIFLVASWFILYTITYEPKQVLIQRPEFRVWKPPEGVCQCSLSIGVYVHLVPVHSASTVFIPYLCHRRKFFNEWLQSANLQGPIQKQKIVWLNLHWAIAL